MNAQISENCCGFFHEKAFIVTPNSALDFLNSFDNVRFDAENRFHFMHVIVLPLRDKNASIFTNRILNHPVTQGKFFKPITNDIANNFYKLCIFSLNISKTFQIY